MKKFSDFFGIARQILTQIDLIDAYVLFTCGKTVAHTEHSLNISLIFFVQPQLPAKRKNVIGYLGTHVVPARIPYSLV